MQLLESGHLEEDYPITSFLKQKMLKFFKKKTDLNNSHEFEGRFLRGQISPTLRFSTVA